MSARASAVLPRVAAIALAIGATLAAGGVRADGDDWEELANKEGVRVLARALPGTGLKQVRAIGVVDVDAERLFAVLGDIGRYPEIMPPTVGARETARDGATAWFHLVIDPPIVKKRDYCVRVELARPEGGLLTSRWVQTDEHCPPPDKHMVRMRRTEGRWLLKPIGPGRTLVDYLAFTDPGGSLPAWMVNRSAASSMKGMFQALAKAAREPRYATCKAESFGCPK